VQLFVGSPSGKEGPEMSERPSCAPEIVQITRWVTASSSATSARRSPHGIVHPPAPERRRGIDAVAPIAPAGRSRARRRAGVAQMGRRARGSSRCRSLYVLPNASPM
jgi:hypothetical protein